MTQRSGGAVHWAFAFPALALMGLVNVIPMGQCLWWSRDFHKLLYDGRLAAALWNTVLFAGVTVSLELALGLAMALLLMQPLPGRGLARAAVLIPWALPTAVMAMGWRWIFNADYGVFGDLLFKLRLVSTPHVPWLAEPGWAMAACVLADVWKTTPFMAVLLMSGLAAIPDELYEAAAIDGAGPWTRFATITWPLLAPAVFVAVIFRAIQAFGIFDLVWVLTGGGPGGRTRMLSLYVYDTVFRYADVGYGCALTLVMAACLLLMAAGVGLAARGKQA